MNEPSINLQKEHFISSDTLKKGFLARQINLLELKSKRKILDRGAISQTPNLDLHQNKSITKRVLNYIDNVL